jgi:hypothetical protein
MTPPSAFRPHPWHGIDPGPRFPELLVAYIEIVPTDGVKYEIDKPSGYLKVDRPQRFSSFCPSLKRLAMAPNNIPRGPACSVWSVRRKAHEDRGESLTGRPAAFA